MKKRTIFFLTFLVCALFLVAFTSSAKALSVKNSGVLSGYEEYTYPGTSTKIFEITDDNDINYYSSTSNKSFPCEDGSCLNNNYYDYNLTGTGYVTCHDYRDFSGNNQIELWNQLASNAYPTIVVTQSGNEINADTASLNRALTTLQQSGMCGVEAVYYGLIEYEHESGHKVVILGEEFGQCEPKITVEKKCTGFNQGNFTIKVGDREITLACGQKSEAIEVSPDTEIIVSELNNQGFITSIDGEKTNSRSFTVGMGITKNVIITNELRSVTLTKTNGITGNPMKGMTFSLQVLEDGEYVDATDIYGNVFEAQTTNESGKLTFTGLKVGKYRMVETSNESGLLVFAAPKDFEVTNNSVNLIEITAVNRPLQIKIKKIDIDGNPLSGSMFSIEKKNTTTGNFETVNQLEIGLTGELVNVDPGIYRITEIQAPLGYDIYQGTITLEVLENGTINILYDDNDNVRINGAELSIINDKSRITINKKDSVTGELIAGAKIRITDINGNEVTSFTTTNKPFRIRLTQGKYFLEEISAPKGYEKLSTKFEFTVDENGYVVATGNDQVVPSGSLTIDIYNAKLVDVPNTGIGTNIVLISLGVLLVAGGSYYVYTYLKKKNAK